MSSRSAPWDFRGLVWPLLLSCCAGCGWVPQSKFAQVESENRRLSEQTTAQLTEIQNLKQHAREVEDQLLAAERGVPRGATAAPTTASAGGAVGKASTGSLVFREVASKEPAAANAAGIARGHLAAQRRHAGGPFSGQLAALAKRYPNLHFDAQTGIGKLDIDILFDSGQAQLKPGADAMLRELVNLLDAPGGQQMNVMVVGHTDSQRVRGAEGSDDFPNNWHLSTARANAVADELRRLGLAGQRLGVAGFGPHQSIAGNEEPSARQQNRRVEIFITAPEVPIVGMTETLGNLY